MGFRSHLGQVQGLNQLRRQLRLGGDLRCGLEVIIKVLVKGKEVEERATQESVYRMSIIKVRKAFLAFLVHCLTLDGMLFLAWSSVPLKQEVVDCTGKGFSVFEVNLEVAVSCLCYSWHECLRALSKKL